MYGAYLPKYEQRKAKNSAFTIDVDGVCVGQTALNLNILVTKVAEYTCNDYRVHVVITETEIPDSWGGLPTVDYCERKMLPNYNGTQVNFDDSDEATVSLSYDLDPAWNYDHLEVVVFIQDKASKEILQGFKAPMSEFTALNANDASLALVENCPLNSCSGLVAPKTHLKNYGTENLTSAVIEYSVNGGDVATYEWTGNLASMEETVVDLPEISFDVQSTNSLQVTVLDPNGVQDEYVGNNSSTVSFGEAEEVLSMELVLRTDGDPQETTWEFIDGSGEVIASGGPYDQPSTIVEAKVPIPVTGPDCVSFKLYDAGGNGMVNGMGIVQIRDENDDLIYDNRGEFGSVDVVEINVAQNNIGVETIEDAFNLSVYPNPAKDATTVSFDLTSGDASVQLVDAYGRVVMNEEVSNHTGTYAMTLSTADLAPGIYFVQINANGDVVSRRLVVK